MSNTQLLINQGQDQRFDSRVDFVNCLQVVYCKCTCKQLTKTLRLMLLLVSMQLLASTASASFRIHQHDLVYNIQLITDRIQSIVDTNRWQDLVYCISVNRRYNLVNCCLLHCFPIIWYKWHPICAALITIFHLLCEERWSVHISGLTKQCIIYTDLLYSWWAWSFSDKIGVTATLIVKLPNANRTRVLHQSCCQHLVSVHFKCQGASIIICK